MTDSKKLETLYKETAEYEGLELSTRIVIGEALRRSIKVNIVNRHENLLALTKNNHTEYIHKATETSRDSISTYRVLENKQATKNILNAQEICVPAGEEYLSLDKAIQNFKPDKKYVVKPTSTNYGIGISFVDQNSSIQSIQSALKNAFSFGDSVITEEFISGDEYRFLVIDDKVCGVCNRVPANVVGNGTDSISKLITQKNSDPRRGNEYTKPLVKIELGEVETLHLKEQGLTESSIPEKGARILLRTNSNISTGGDSFEVTDTMHPSYFEIATKAAKAAKATFCGADIIIPNPNSAGPYSIIELNFNPVLFIHEFPYHGSPRRVGPAVLDAIGFNE